MNNFGVREVANSKSAAAPGWAYVPDNGASTSLSTGQPSSRKRARNTIVASTGETTAKEDAKILRELAALDRENHRDVTIPVPVKHRDNAGRATHGKVTPAVRKVLQSNKTFANYLADFEAQGAQSSYAPTLLQPAQPPTPTVRAALGPGNAHFTSTSKRSHKKKDQNAVVVSTPLRKVSSSSRVLSSSTDMKPEAAIETPVTEVDVLSQSSISTPVYHPGDNDPLLVSRIPKMPSAVEINKLLAEPPLNYFEARGLWVAEDRRKPIRLFCEKCGYWGKVKCTKCGGRVCALECYQKHVEECLRYGS